MKLAAKVAYLKGDATRPVGTGFKVIAHICNDEGKWGKGFVLAISKRWREPEKQYRQWFGQAPKPQLGEVQFVDVEPQLAIANMIGQHGIRRGQGGAPPIRYEATGQCLSKVAAFARERGASVHMPRIGCGLAGGTWEEMGPIISKQLVDAGLDVFVYDFE